MSNIHPTAIVDPKAKIGKGTKVGAYSIIGPEVVLGENCDVQEHVVMRGTVTVGNESKFYPFCVIGAEPQHFGYKNEPTTVTIGNRVTLRESVTIHRGTAIGTGKTTIGDDVYMMAYSHAAHDCEIGNKVLIGNCVQLAGHVTLENYAVIGGQSAIAPFCRIGRYCYVAGGSILRKDLPPFLIGKGNDFQVQGVNVLGLEKAGFSPPTIQRLKKLYKIFYVQKQTIGQAMEKVMIEIGDTDESKVFIDFIKSSKVGFIR
jgi:UDP-N-acetylglucosamine acyltransferase